jgi:hypothetical protein
MHSLAKFEIRRDAAALCFYFHGLMHIRKTLRVTLARAARIAVQVSHHVELRGG